MPSKCGVSSCLVYSNTTGYKLFRIPAVRSRGSPGAQQQMLQRRSLWASSCGLSDPPARHILICSRHFVSGKPAHLHDVQDVDWVPTLHLNGDDPGPGTSCGDVDGQGREAVVATPAPLVAELREIDGPAPAVSCCVPDCINPNPEWVTNLPNDRELRGRWLMAIQVGTGGQPVAAAATEDGKKGVCNMHFAAPQPLGTDETGYREPTMFVRDNVLMQVVNCRLCLTFDLVDHMYDMKSNLRDGRSLQWMAKAYFGQFSSTKEYHEEGFFCERCTVQIDMAHSFWRELSENARKLKWLLAKMEVFVFGKHITLPTIKQEEITLAKPRIKEEQPLEPPVEQTVPTEPSEHAAPNSNSLNEPDSLEDTNIQVECDPRLYDSSSDEDDQGLDAQNQQIKTEPADITDELPYSTETVPPYLMNPTPKMMTELSKFKCYLCQITQTCKNSLIHHLMMDHQDHKSLHCPECNVTFEKITVFNKHLGMHDPAKRLKCSVCPLRFWKTSAKLKHESAVHGLQHFQNNSQQQPATATTVKDKTKKNQCSQCDKAFVYISELRRHEKFKHQGEVIAQCEICEKTFASERNLTRHLKLHRDDEQPPSLTTRTTAGISCNLCQVSYRATRDMVAHLKQSHPEAEFQTYPCQHCDEVFFSMPSRANHNNIHTDIHACDQCGKRHYSKVMLQRHRYAKHGIPLDEDQFRNCVVCGKRYIKGTDYLRHMRTHETEKFECPICHRKFREREQLRIHERVHTHEKPHECVACGARFGSPASLSRHKKICSKRERK